MIQASTIKVSNTLPVANEIGSTASITIGSWYQGDMLGQTHRLDEV